MAAHNSTAAAGPTNAGLTHHRFRIDSGSTQVGLIGLRMSLATAELPADPAALRAFALACQGELKAAQTAVQLKALEIEKLRFQIAKLRRMQFGRSSERITRQIEQLELQLEELESSEAEDVARAEAREPDAPAPARAKPKRKPLPENLPRQDVLHQPAGDGACICPACGGGMGKLGEDVTEVLDYVPGHFQVIRHVRPKYACTACDAITQARLRRCRHRAAAPRPPRWRICWSSTWLTARQHAQMLRCRSTATTVCHEHTDSDGGVELCER